MNKGLVECINQNIHGNKDSMAVIPKKDGVKGDGNRNAKDFNNNLISLCFLLAPAIATGTSLFSVISLSSEVSAEIPLEETISKNEHF